MQPLTWFLFLFLATLVVSHRQGTPENEKAQSSYTGNKFEKDFEALPSSIRCRVRPELPGCQPAEKRRDILSKLFSFWKNDADSELIAETKRQIPCRRPHPGANYCKREDTGKEEVLNLNEILRGETDED